MTDEEYKRRKSSIDSHCEMMKGTTPKDAIEVMRKGWMEELENERCRSEQRKATR